MARQISIQRKIMLAIISASVIVLVISIFTFSIYDLTSYKSDLKGDLITMAGVMGENCDSSLKFRNAEDAKKVLSSLRFEPEIAAAALYNDKGTLFAIYAGGLRGVPSNPGPSGFREENGNMEIFQPISYKGEKVGTLYLRSDLTPLYRRFRLYALMALFVVVGSAVATFFISRNIEKRISKPILALAGTARVVSQKQDYSVRAQKLGEDEIGLLTDAFNLMLARIDAQTAELQESRERLNLALKAGEAGSWDWNIPADKLTWDQQNELLFGLGRGEFKGTYEHFLHLLHPDDRDEASHDISEALGQKKDYLAEFRVIWKDGSIHDLIVRGKAVYDGNGKPFRMSGLTLDITEQKRAEAARGLLAAIVESSDDAIISATLDGKMMSWNQGAEKLYGYTSEEAVGQPVTIMIPPERLKEERDFLERVRNGKAVEHVETVRIRKGGSPVDVSVTISPIRDDKGNIIGASKTARDISESKRVERALRENESRKSAILESALDAIITMDEHGQIVEFNPAAERLFGRKRREVIGRTVAETIIPERLRQMHADGIKRYIETGQGPVLNKRIEMPALKADGSEFLSELAISATELEGGQLFFTAYLRDITERKQTEEEIRRLNTELEKRAVELEHRVQERTTDLIAANKELEAFTYSVAHDLRAPLRHINAFAKILQEDYSRELSEEVQSYLERIRASSHNLSHLVDDLLNLARVGRQELVYQPCDMSQLIEQARAELSGDMQGRDIEWRIQKQFPKVNCDPGLMKVVFINLLSNAIKYSRPRAKAIIEIGCADEDGRQTFFVRDNGVGFNIQYGNKLFGVFQRLHRAEEFEGTGVGLATVDRIIRKHGGRIWAESEPDKGATFFFTLTPAEKPEKRRILQETAV